MTGAKKSASALPGTWLLWQAACVQIVIAAAAAVAADKLAVYGSKFAATPPTPCTSQDTELL
jgi:hypothetical protein